MNSVEEFPLVTYDTYNNAHIDFSKISLNKKETVKAVKGLIFQWIDAAIMHKKHMLILKLLPTQASVHKYALNAGFYPHHADQSETVMALCLQSHNGKECNYPAYKTAFIGVTGVRNRWLKSIQI